MAAPRFLDRDVGNESCWRAIVRFGLNVASYKFAPAPSPMGAASESAVPRRQVPGRLAT
jgi:hypothetical protein